MNHPEKPSPLLLLWVPFAIILVVGAAVGFFWLRDISTDRSYQISITNSIPLYSIPPIDFPDTNPVLVTLNPGEPVRVLRLRYSKDFRTFRIRTSGGKTGWVIDGKGIEITSHG